MFCFLEKESCLLAKLDMTFSTQFRRENKIMKREIPKPWLHNHMVGIYIPGGELLEGLLMVARVHSDLWDGDSCNGIGSKSWFC